MTLTGTWHRTIVCTALAALGALFGVTSLDAEAFDLPTVYGISLGSKAEFKECPYDYSLLMKRFVYADEARVPEPCFRRIGEPGGSAPEALITIVFPTHERPRLSSTGHVTLYLIDGTIEAIGFPTDAPQEQVVGTLSSKFGTPSKQGKVPVNLSSGTITATWTAWFRPGYSIEYKSPSGVLVATPKGSELIRKRTIEAMKEARPL